MPLIEIENLSVTFRTKGREVRAVQDVSLTVEKGESFGLVGESGSGKSTILRAICGMAPVSGGTIRINGQPLPTPRGRDFARQVQMVFQDPYASLHPRHTIDRTLSEPLAIHGIPGTDDRVIRALRDVGLPTAFRFRYPHQLSGGQRQRVAIARAIALEPEFILLDEPTSALDLSVQAQIIDLLRKLQREKGLSYLFISHDLKVVRALCHRVIVMQHGRIVEQGPVEAVLENPTTDYTRRLVKAAFEIAA